MLRLAEPADVSNREATAIVDEVQSAIARWPEHAAPAEVSTGGIKQIAKSLPKLG